MTRRTPKRHPSPQELTADYEAGWTVKDLAKREGWNQRVIISILRRHGKEELAKAEAARACERAKAEALQDEQRKEANRAERARRREAREAAAAQRDRDLNDRMRAHRDQRLDELAAQYAQVRTVAAAYNAEVEFERRERAALAAWLKNYADILTA